VAASGSTNGDRVFLTQLYRWFPSVLKSITIICPGTPVRWHRAGVGNRAPFEAGRKSTRTCARLSGG
jgi:hypothetical protein